MRVRSAGILLHPTALPGGFGIGDLGPSARSFLDWLVAAGQSVWQILPLGPPGLGDAPYGTMSAFAGNPLLISPEDLVADGLLPSSALADLPADEPSEAVDFGATRMLKEALLRESWRHVREQPGHPALGELEAFEAESVNSIWLDDWALFAALKGRFQHRSWMDWPPGVRLREAAEMATASQELAGEIGYQIWIQLLFDRQWRRLRSEAAKRGIRIFGDVPIYVIADSADVWSRQHLFTLDEEGRPSELSGVPPDAFAEDGQLWGHPLYRWDRMRDDGFGWWLARLRAAFEQADIVRLDHFRGFAGYWSVPAGAETARDGEWRPGPGAELFEALARGLGEVEIVAEDLGVITPDVIELRKRFDIPGLKVLQFGFGELDSPHLPHRHNQHTVVYTGTHDNDTTRGWYADLDEEARRRVLDYVGGDASDVTWSLIRAAFLSVGRVAIVPIQDILDLGSEARFNMPGIAEGNWAWRLSELPGREVAERLRGLTLLAGRLPSSTNGES
ncbi:MAG: 4-alpha-glucanotransferase [Thermoanaerobaculia bacterium]